MNRNIPTGPLLTNRLHNLDLELDILKRKREILEQQQMLASRNSQSFQEQRSFDYNQPKSTNMYGQQQYSPWQQYNQNHNFSYLYEQGPGSSGNRNQFDRKRQAGHFQDDPPAKRFSGPQKGKPRKAFNQGPRAQFKPGHKHQPFTGQQAYNASQRAKPFSIQPQPLMSSKAKPNQMSSKPNQKYPKLKPKPDPCSIAQRKAYVNKILSKGLDNEDDSLTKFILKPGEVPPKIFGRLELGLGQIMKEIRDKYASVEEYSICFRSSFLKRVMKSTLRNRIKEVMMGKAVTNGHEILGAYREKYPIETDIDIVKLAMQARNETKDALNLMHSEDPWDFYNLNIQNLINMSLDEMFTKLHKMYEDEMAVPATVYNVSEEEYAKATQNNPDTIDDGSANATVDTSIETTAADKTVVEPITTTNNQEPDNNERIKVETDVDINKEDVKPKQQETSNKHDVSKKIDIKNIGDLVDKMLKQKLPEILPKFREHLFKILEADRTYKAGRAIILSTARSMAAKTGVTPRMLKDGPPERTNDMPYYVKVVGRPSLPKKPIMRKFLDKFQPNSIKKHKTVHNLLFIGFKNKKNFDDILSANGTSLGNCTITIKVSEKATQQNIENQQTTNDNDVIIIEDRKGDTQKTVNDIQSDTIEINDDMNNQIDELLSSIRKSEENQEENDSLIGSIEVDVKPENKTDDTKSTETGTENNNTEENKPEQNNEADIAAKE